MSRVPRRERCTGNGLHLLPPLPVRGRGASAQFDGGDNRASLRVMR